MTKKIIYEDAKIGLRIRMARVELGFTQKRLADELGVSSQQVQKFEFGYNRVSVKVLYQLSKITSKPLGWFVQDLDEEYDQINIKQFSLRNDFLTNLVKVFQQVSDEKVQKTVMQFARIMVELNKQLDD